MNPLEYWPHNADCRNWTLWHRHVEDSQMSKVCSCEIEVLEFLQALVSMLKPRLIVELGCNAGIAAEYLINGYDSAIWMGIENDPEMMQLAQMRLHKYQARTVFHQTDALEFGKDQQWDHLDFLFVDTAQEGRGAQMLQWIPRLSKFGVCAVHDSDTSRSIRQETEDVAREQNLQLIHFPTPRGLTLLRRKP